MSHIVIMSHIVKKNMSEQVMLITMPRRSGKPRLSVNEPIYGEGMAGELGGFGLPSSIQCLDLSRVRSR